jgi:hypothetical protein
MMPLVILAALAAAPAAAPPHSVAFWQQIAQNKYAVPPGSNLTDLTAELSDLLASPDPVLRDEIAYSTLTAWIYQTRVLDADMLRTLVNTLLANLRSGIGERGTDSVFGRSFSALMLSVVVARDNAAPFLSADEFHGIERAAQAYLRAEQDLRGYDPGHGWAHSAAHTADLLKFIGRSRHLDAAGQAQLLDAVTQKLTSAPVVFTYGEDERFARAVLSIVNREDFDRAAFASWVARTKPTRPGAKPTVAELAHAQNAKNLFAKLDVLLDGIQEPSDAVRSAHDSVRAALKDAF